MSNVTAIHNAIAAQDITFTDGRIIEALTLDAAVNRVLSDSLPFRIIMPPGATGGPGIQAYEPIAGKMAKVTWRVTDLMLYEAVGRGDLGEIWTSLTDYIGLYVQTFTASRRVANGTIIGFLPQAGVFQWPEGGTSYHGVLTTVLVEETVCGT